MIPQPRVFVLAFVAGLVLVSCSPAPQLCLRAVICEATMWKVQPLDGARRNSSISSSERRQEQCPLGDEVVVGGSDGRRAVMVVPVVGGLGASAARTSCRTRQARPLFLDTQQDADILHRLLKDCVKTGKISSVWVPARRHAHLKRINRPLAETTITSLGNVEYDWMNAQYNRTTDNITLVPFPEKVNQRKGILCVRVKAE
ncbi:uncharacterized protein [Cherax quadricarinatus]|uniref:uncharacterized protein isoform X1 n=1 Tax=Cherax quadricarinatus TaxID=27406 RepID=UPI0023787734|nr:uncharacterized protein LOC128693502 isoform X1 [Cherax quadricarinatus]